MKANNLGWFCYKTCIIRFLMHLECIVELLVLVRCGPGKFDLAMHAVGISNIFIHTFCSLAKKIKISDHILTTITYAKSNEIRYTQIKMYRSYNAVIKNKI